MKNNLLKVVLALVGIGIIVIIPMRIYCYADDKSQWLSFLGSYLGGVIGTIGAFVGIYITIQNEKSIRKEFD